MPDPRQVRTLTDLTRALSALRRRAAGTDEVMLPVRAVAERVGKASSTMHPYLRGDRLCPADTYEKLLRALGVPTEEFGPWLDAWERIADEMTATIPEVTASSLVEGPGSWTRRETSLIVSHFQTFIYTLAASPPSTSPRLGIVTGDIRRIHLADIWVNSENTDMEMARHNEYSVSAVIRFEGASRDHSGRVIEDHIATELDRKVAGRRPVAPATVISTGPGMLAQSNGVRHVIHVAAVQGEPGRGYRQVVDIGRCATNVLAEAEHLAADDSTLATVLFPLLGVGVGGADIEPTVRALVGATIDHMATAQERRIRTTLFLAHTEEELAVCRASFDAHPALSLFPGA